MEEATNKPQITNNVQGEHFTDQERRLRQELFCTAYQQTLCNITASCQHAKVTYHTYKHWLTHDVVFQDMLKAAKQKAQDSLRGVILEHGIQGVKRLVIQGGKVVTDLEGKPVYETVYDNRILLRMASTLLPEYKELALQGKQASQDTIPISLNRYYVIAKEFLLQEDIDYLEGLAQRIQAMEQEKRSGG